MKELKKVKGIKVAHRKLTAGFQTEVMPPPPVVYVSLSQHLGPPCTPLVQVGDKVAVGQPIGESEALFSAPVHATVSGTVRSIQTIRSLTGGEERVILINSDKKQTPWEGLTPPKAENKDEFIAAIRTCGLVGLGGAAFPTHVKFNPKNLDEVDTLIVNGAECEPYITSDHRAMLEDTEDIIEGILLLMKFLELKKAYIGVESNKENAIVKLKNEIKEKNVQGIEVVTLPAVYPQGAERVLVYEITGKPLKAGQLPASLGVILANVNTVSTVSKYFKTGMPLVSKRVTIDGSAIKRPKNVMVPIGTPISDIVDFCGGYQAPPKKMIMGGPMMGKAIFSDDFPIIKNTNAIIALSGDEAIAPKET
ncbi:MAG: RnfABCDGE type electron transport complex subunit C, partial [Anaerovoracaceae bacterium]